MKLEAEVKREIYKKLLTLESTGLVLWFERLNVGKIQNALTGSYLMLCRTGCPDFVVVVEDKKGNLSVIFVEAKREGCFTERKGEQTIWREKYSKKHINMVYIVAQSVDDMMKHIISVSKNQLDRIDFQ